MNVIAFSSSLHPFLLTLIVAGNVRGMYSILVIRYFNPHHYLLLWLLLASLLYLDIGNVLQCLALFLALSANLICHFLFWASAKICDHDLTRTIPVQSVFWTVFFLIFRVVSSCFINGGKWTLNSFLLC